MGFIKSFEEIMANFGKTADFYNAEMLTVFWETKPEIIKKLLPSPLEPADFPLAMAFVADYPKTSFNVVYQESALFLHARFKGEEGGYCLAMPVTNDMAMAGGREVFGFPKKIGNVCFKREADMIEGWTERHGIRFMTIRAVLNGQFNAENAQDIIMNRSFGADGTVEAFSYNFKHFPAPEGSAFDYNPRLVKQKTVLHPSIMEFGTAEITFQPSDYDPWSEVEVVRMLGCIYTKGDNTMLAGEVVDEVDPIQFAPHAFLKWDMV